MKKPQKSKVKKAQRKARARRALKSAHPAAPPAPEKPHVYPFQENQSLHATHRHFAEMARSMEKTMADSRWSRS